VGAPLTLHERLHRVHRLDHAFDHRQQEGPARVVRLQELHKGVREEIILHESPEERLIGDVMEDGHRGAEFTRQQ
jgi:hypothetical protein